MTRLAMLFVLAAVLAGCSGTTPAPLLVQVDNESDYTWTVTVSLEARNGTVVFDRTAGAPPNRVTTLTNETFLRGHYVARMEASHQMGGTMHRVTRGIEFDLGRAGGTLIGELPDSIEASQMRYES